MNSTIDSPIKVLVVDDSGFMRKTIAAMLNSEPCINVVGEAVDGEDAVKKVKTLSPDIVTMDIEMPRMNGLEAIRIIMKEMPLPVIVVSSLTETGAKETIKALEHGAVDYISKNLSGNIANIAKIKNDLIEKVKIFGHRKIKIKGLSDAGKTITLTYRCPPHGKNRINIVVIGASTGGPRALQEVLPRLPKNIPCGVLVVQHMLPLFTASFAERMNDLSQVEVREARDGDLIKPGFVLIAPGGYHLKIRRWPGDEGYVKLSKEPPLPHMPSVDIAMESVAQAFSYNALGVIMTGMGQDGKEGMKAIREAKGRTIAQDKETSTIFGMPKAAIDSGCVDRIVPLGKMAEEIINML